MSKYVNKSQEPTGMTVLILREPTVLSLVTQHVEKASKERPDLIIAIANYNSSLQVGSACSLDACQCLPLYLP